TSESSAMSLVCRSTPRSRSAVRHSGGWLATMQTADKAREHAKEIERRRQERAGTSDEQAVTDAGQQAAAKARPKPKAQANFTDPDSRIMMNSDGAYLQAYNAQAILDAEHQV